MSAPDAAEAAALVRAALARGFAMIEGRSGADMPSAAENERILTHLARQALAEAKAWRDALRRNALDAVTPKIAAAAAVGAPLDARTPDPLLMREVARMLAAAAAENAAREDGVYAEDRAALMRRLPATWLAPSQRPRTMRSRAGCERRSKSSSPTSSASLA